MISESQEMSKDGDFDRDLRRRERTLPALLAVAALAGVSGAFAVVFGGQASLAVLMLLALFAVGGTFTAFAWACGLVHFGAKAPPHDLALRALDASRDGFAVTDADGAVLFANKAFCDLIGHRDGPLPGIDTLLRIWAGSAEQAFRLMRAARRSEGWQHDFASGLANWPVQHLRVSVAPIRSGGGARTSPGPFLAWRVSDVSAERQREARAMAKLELSQFALDEASIGLIVLNRTGAITYANSVFASWLDLGKPGQDPVWFPELLSRNADSFLENIDFSTPSSSVESLDLELVKRDSSIVPVRIFYRIAMPPGDNELKFVGLVINHALPQFSDEESEETADHRFSKVFNSAPVAMGLVSRGGRLSLANPALINLLGVSGSRAWTGGLNIVDLVAPDHRPLLVETMEKALARKAGIPPVPIALASDPSRTGRLYFSPLITSRQSQQPPVAVVYGIDTSEQRALEEQVAQSQKMQAVGQLAGGIAHDFNNMLTAIIGFSDLLLARHRASDPAFKDIMNIKQNANRAASLVRQLLAFSRRQTMRPRVLLLTDVLQDLVILLGRLLGEKINLRVIHGRDLWLVKADQNQLEQVIINLAVNARDAMPDGGELTIRTANISERDSLKLAASGLKPGEYLMCEVSDTGCGMGPEIMDKIFEPFFSTKEVGKGTGLGLSMVYGIVKQTGGHITVESQPGAGAIFRIYLPRHIETDADREILPAKPEKKEKPSDLTGSGTILLVEDEDAVRAFTSRALTTRGYKVIEAVNGFEAIDVMNSRAREVDLVISDVVMPGMEGPALLKRLREQNPDLKFILISGYAEEAFKDNLDESEPFTFLPKPFSLKELAAAVKQTLGAPS
jgi:two-component system cell cycle sensor histidine kinase/response regulator CckA